MAEVHCYLLIAFESIAQGNETTLGVCGNAVMVLTKEEMKREIRDQISEELDNIL